MSNQLLASSYLAAVGASCGIAYFLKSLTGKVIANSAQHFITTTFLRSFIPYISLTLSSCFNVYFIRWNEITEGINVSVRVPKEEGGDINDWKNLEIGKSKIAGHVALAKCCLARCIWSTGGSRIRVAFGYKSLRL